jgi:hypothetical protein
LLSLAPPTIPFIADEYRPPQNSGADSAAWAGDSNDPAASPARPSDRGEQSETYPSEGTTRPISPAPNSPGIPYGNVPSYTPPSDDDDDSYSPSPGSSAAGELIDIGKPFDLQSSPLSSTELPGEKSEARDVLDMLSALNYVPSKQATKEFVSPSLTPQSSNDIERLPRPDALGVGKARKTIDDDSVVLQRHPIVETSPDASLSAAAIDALLEIPTKIESVQSAFQAFEVSAGANVPLPLAPPTRQRSENDFQPPATDVGLTVGDHPALCGALLPSIGGQTASPAAETASDAALSAFEQPLNSIDESAVLDRRLDMITATLITALIGRAVWKLSTESAHAPEPPLAKGKIWPPSSRNPIRRHSFGYTILDPRG